MRPAKRTGKQIINNLMGLNLTSVNTRLVANVWYGFASFKVSFSVYQVGHCCLTNGDARSWQVLWNSNFQFMFPILWIEQLSGDRIDKPVVILWSLQAFSYREICNGCNVVLIKNKQVFELSRTAKGKHGESVWYSVLALKLFGQ